MKPITTNTGFTLIELIAVIVVLGVLTVVALPRFIDLSDAARGSTIRMLSGSAQSINALVIAKVRTGTDTQAVPNRIDLIDIDLDANGSFETRLKWGFLDNTDIAPQLRLSSEFVVTFSGFDVTFIGYDLDGDGNANNDNCYFQYTQAESASIPPVYNIVTSGC